MAFRYGAPAARESEFQEVYFNKYLAGTLLAPLWRVLFYSFGIVLYTPLFVALAIVAIAAPIAYLLGWQNAPPKMTATPGSGDIKDWLGLALMALVGLIVVAFSVRALLKVWAVFFRIARSRFHLMAGLPLASVEGVPTFSGGMRSYRSGSKPPDKLEIGAMKFDLNHCWRFRNLLKLGTENFLGAEALPSGLASGFTLTAPLRVWYVPSTGVLVRVELQPPGQTELIGKAETLKRELMDWYQRRAGELSKKDRAKTCQLIDELESLKAQLASRLPAHAREKAEDRLAELEQWLSALDIYT
jgi:hypothetical protein